MSCDLLGSFYLPYLAQSTQHIVRTSDSSKGDVDLPDSFYKTKIGRIGSNDYSSSDLVYTKSNYSNVVTKTSMSDYFSISTDGCYIVGVVNINGKGLTFYRMNENAFYNFITKALQISITMSTGSGNLNSNLARAIYDPIQYIKYCRWFPVNVYVPGSAIGTLNVGSASITLDGNNFAYLVRPQDGVIINGMLLNIPKNPYGGTLRSYLSLSPFSEYNLYFPTLGMIPLDSARMYKYSKLELKWITDCTTGNTDFFIIPTNRTSLSADNDPDTYIPSSNTQSMFYSALSLGVDVPLYNLSFDLETGIVLTGMSWLHNYYTSNSKNKSVSSENRKSVGNGESMPSSPYGRDNIESVVESSKFDNAKSILKDTIDYWLDGTASSLGQLKSQGTPASYMTYSDTSYPFICAMFFTQENMQLAKYGMPSDFIAQLDTLTGHFVMCKNPQFNVTSPSTDPFPVVTRDEQNVLMEFLEEGIYIE